MEAEKRELLTSIKLKEMGFVSMDRAKFENSVAQEDRIIGFSGHNETLKVFVIGKEKLSKMGYSYKDCLDEILDIKFYNQRLGEEFELDSSSNMDMIEKYESFLTKSKMINDGNKSKNKRSVKGLR